MTSHPQALEVVRGIYDAVGRGDWDGVLSRVHPAAVFTQSSALPFGGEWRGHEGFRTMGDAIFKAWPDFSVRPLRFAQEGDVVLVVTRVDGSNPAGDGRLDQEMIEYWRVVDGQAVECRPFYFDPGKAAKSAGA